MASGRHVVPVPRIWLAILTGLVVLPWLVVGVWYYSGRVEAGLDADIAVAGPAAAADPGPWGRLSLTPIVVSPPLEYVAADWARDPGPDRWFFPGVTREMLEAFLVTSGCSPAQVAALMSAAKPAPDIRGQVVTPDPGLVRGLTPELRARLYLQLAKSPLNFDQANAFRFFGTSVQAWLDGSPLSPRTRQLVESLIYTDGEFLHFADAEIAQAEIKDDEERRRLAKTLLRQPTVLVELSVPDAAQIDRLSDYWGRGGRRTDVRPLLESLAHSPSHKAIDIVHLLPAFARNHLYRYPKLSTADLDKPLLANCLWTVLNFFRFEPDDRFLDVKVALDTLRREYYVVEGEFQLGDIVALLDEDGDIFHAAVVLADDLVFTKNGTSPMAPWIITTVEQLKGYYRARSANPRLIYHRRHDL